MSALDQRLSRLMLLLYEGASTPERLQVFLSELAGEMNAGGAAFRDHVFDRSDNVNLKDASLFVSVGYSEEALREYSEYFHTKDIHVQRVLERCRTAQVGVSQALATDAELHKTELYNDYQKRFDIGPIIWGKLVEKPDHVSGVSFSRLEGQPLFDMPELELVTALVPHMRQALHLSRTLRNLEASNAMLEQSLEEMEIAICMVRQDGSVLRSTRGAEHVFATRDGVWLHKGRLRTAADREQRALDALIAGACRTGANAGLDGAMRVQSRAAGDARVRSWTSPSGGAMLLSRKPPLRPLQVVVSPFCSGTLLDEPQATALIQFSDPSAALRSRAAVLRALYDLTPTESRLADLLLQGFEVREAADRLGTTLATARFHLKRVLAKTGTRRQVELMRLMLSLPGQ
jgi:DNA-binding CsgD family transcriptional regulator